MKRLFHALKTHRDAGWYAMASVLPPIVALLLGPLILRKVGLGDFALLGLCSYFVVLASTYIDLGGFSHLLAIFSRGAHERRRDFANLMVLRLSIWMLIFLVLGVAWSMHPRSDSLYTLLAVSFLGFPFSSLNIEWYFLAHKQYFRIFLSRVAMLSVQIILTVLWLIAPHRGLVIVPLLSVLAGVAAFFLLVWFLPKGWTAQFAAAFREASFAGALRLALRLLPVAGSGMLVPYFLAYAMPWFTRVAGDREMEGTFSISYRLALGFLSLVAPMIFYMMPRMNASSQFRAGRILGLSVVATALFWISGTVVLVVYFRISRIDPAFFSQSLAYFSILLISVFLMCLRTPCIGKLFLSQHYLRYFLIHLAACLPTLALSLWPGLKVPLAWVPWLSCTPDLLATAAFIFYFYRGPGRAKKLSGALA